jgi:putative spermidine/putrescine transport system substrate-binding protein
VNLVAGRPAENRELALKFIDYTLRPEVAAGWAEDARYSPLNRTTELPPEVAGDVVYGEEAINQLVAFDTTKVNEEKPKWIDAWNKLLAQ